MLVSNTKPTGSPSVLYTYIATEKGSPRGTRGTLAPPAPPACPFGVAVESGEWRCCDDLFSTGGGRNIAGAGGRTVTKLLQEQCKCRDSARGSCSPFWRWLRRLRRRRRTAAPTRVRRR